ncbi:MAG: hypothetical protein RL268_2628, partial [Pseudomonadota bacterium]
MKFDALETRSQFRCNSGFFTFIFMKLWRIFAVGISRFQTVVIRILVGGGAEPQPPSPLVALPTGGALGLIAGLTGTGCGIFLSPLLILMRWAEARTVAGISAAFIFCNSAAGLLGQGAKLEALPAETPWYVGAVIIGGLLGSKLGVGTIVVALLGGWALGISPLTILGLL